MAAYDGSIRIDTKINSSGFNNGVKSISSGLNNITGALKKMAVAVGLAFSVKAVIDFGKASVSAATELENAMTGLQSIMEGQGRSFKKAKGFIDEYISDGLVPATQAINAYKNLALRGYDDTQIQQVLVALKDSAAFGRQASYSLGEAVVSATEGLKNENSILVDNAGVTKNVAKMWDEYAKKIGTTSNNLTQQQKIQAEVNGILEETKYQTGDAAKIADSYSGQVLKLGYALNNFKIAVGNALMPVIKNIIPPLIEIVNWFTRLANAVAQVTAALFGKTVKVNTQIAESSGQASAAVSNLADSEKAAGDAAEKAGKQAKGALANFDDLNVLAQNSEVSAKEENSFGAGNGVGTSLSEFSDMTGEGADISSELMEKIEKFKRLIENIKKALEPTINALKRLWEQLKVIGGFAWDALQDFYETFLKPVGEWFFGEDSGLAKFVNIIKEGLEKIDWQKINDALHELWNALTPFVINIGEGLLWFLENVLVPLGVWAMNNIVPLVIEGIAAAIEALNGVINALKPLGEWLWENFLKPIAEWTGGIIVDVLTSIVEGLQDFANWINENEGAVQAITLAVAAFFAAWEVTSLGAFIINAGGIVAILGKLAAALYASTVAKIVDAAQTAYLVALYAKDFAVALANNVVNLAKDTAAWVASTAAKAANTAAQIAQTAAATAWNAVCTVSTAVTTAFGAAVAFLTSPIGLVVIAIGALIAIVAILITHWDEVKEHASKAWDFIKKAWEEASDWISTNVTEPIGNFFSGLWDDVKLAASQAWEDIKLTFSSAKTWFDENVIMPIKNAFKIGINGMIGFVEGFVNRFIKGINSIIEAINSISFDIPEFLGGGHVGFNLATINEIKIPKLATGAVIPPNQEFLAILGDQKRGRNLEAPEGLIRQIMREELAGLQSGSGDITITFDGNLAQLARVLNPVIKKENKRIGATLQTGGAY